MVADSHTLDLSGLWSDMGPSDLRILPEAGRIPAVCDGGHRGAVEEPGADVDSIAVHRGSEHSVAILRAGGIPRLLA